MILDGQPCIGSKWITNANELKMANQRQGKREREARKRRPNRRTVVSFHNGSEWVTLKLGRKKLERRHRTGYRRGNLLPF